MLESLENTRNTYKTAVKVNLIKRGLRDLKNQIKQMSKNKIESGRPDVIVDLFKNILDFNESDSFYTPEESPRNIMLDLETEESAAERRKHEGHGLKILTPQQIHSRLPIFLPQLKARNNSQKLKNKKIIQNSL